MPGISGVTVVTILAWLFFLPAGLRARWAPGIPCALTVRGEGFLHNPGEIAPRECGGVLSTVTAREGGRSGIPEPPVMNRTVTEYWIPLSLT